MVRIDAVSITLEDRCSRHNSGMLIQLLVPRVPGLFMGFGKCCSRGIKSTYCMPDTLLYGTYD
jgi:hypothetical protein